MDYYSVPSQTNATDGTAHAYTPNSDTLPSSTDAPQTITIATGTLAQSSVCSPLAADYHTRSYIPPAYLTTSGYDRHRDQDNGYQGNARSTDPHRRTTPPPPEYDSWSLVGDRRHQTDRRWNMRGELSKNEGWRRRGRDGENRRSKREISSVEALTFYRYGPPTTVGGTSPMPPRIYSPVPHPRVVAVVQQGTKTLRSPRDVSPTSSVDADELEAIVTLGASPEGDGFFKPVGKHSKNKRPDDWRPGYVTSNGILSYLARFIRAGFSSKSYPSGVPATRSRRLSDSILYLPSPDEEPGTGYDLRRDPLIAGTSAHTRLPFDDTSELATTPAAVWMRLYHTDLPWYIDVETDGSRGITVWDILQQMHEQLMVPLTSRDVWNKEMNNTTRKGVAQGYRRRVHRVEKGLLYITESPAVRLDFLGNSYIFEGLTHGRNGMWKIKTRDWRA